MRDLREQIATEVARNAERASRRGQRLTRLGIDKDGLWGQTIDDLLDIIDHQRALAAAAIGEDDD